MSEQEQAAKAAPTKGFLGTVERVGNALPDPAVLFIALLPTQRITAYTVPGSTNLAIHPEPWTWH